MKLRKMRQAVIGMALALGMAGAAVADPRVALVIGNGAYAESPLSNSLNDSRGIKTALQNLGFKVIYLENADRLQMNRATDEFAARLEADSEGLFYFSGHGAQVEGSNYLLPLSAEIRDAVDLQHHAFDVGLVLDKMRLRGNRFNLVILDACRDNPFKGFKAAIGGLASMSGPEGTLIAFASAPNTSALNNKSGNNSLFTKHLLLHISEPGLKIEDLLKKVRLGVKADSPKPEHPQTPWENGSMLGDFCFAGCAGAMESEAEQKLRVAEEIIRQYKEREHQAQAVQPSIGGEQGNAARPVPRVHAERGKDEVLVEPSVRPAPPTKTKTDSVLKVESIYGIEMVKLPGGKFQMGCGPKDEDCYDDKMPRHEVTVKAFALAKTEVTQGQWRAVMGDENSNFRGCGDDCAADGVSWNEAQAFIKILNAQTSGGYRLPSEAEWEYACRAGGDSLHCGGDDLKILAWFNDNSNSETHPVGENQANKFGLYDMSGNVWEWVWNCFDDRHAAVPTDGRAWDDGKKCFNRVARGGSWGDTSLPETMRLPYVEFAYPDANYTKMGFRLARDF